MDIDTLKLCSTAQPGRSREQSLSSAELIGTRSIDLLSPSLVEEGKGRGLRQRQSGEREQREEEEGEEEEGRGGGGGGGGKRSMGGHILPPPPWTS